MNRQQLPGSGRAGPTCSGHALPGGGGLSPGEIRGPHPATPLPASQSFPARGPGCLSFHFSYLESLTKWLLREQQSSRAAGSRRKPPPPNLVSMVTGYGLPHRPVWGHTHTRTHSCAPSSPASPGPAPHLAPPSWWLWTSWSALLRLFLSAEWALPDPPQGAMEDRVCLGATGSGAGAGRPHGRGRPQLG